MIFRRVGQWHFCADIELDFRLCTRRTDRNNGAVGGNELQNVRFWQCDFGLGLGLLVDGLAKFVVFNANNLRTSNLLRRVAAEVGHHLLNLLGARFALLHNVYQFLAIEPVAHVDFCQQVEQRLALAERPRGGLGNERRRHNGVFVAHEIAAKVAVRFLATANELLLALVALNGVGNELETCEHIVVLNAEILGHRGKQFGGYYRFDNEFLAFQFAVLFPLVEQVVDKD